MGTRSIRDKKKGVTKEPFVMLKTKWMATAAYKRLTGNAVKMLLELIRLSGGDNGNWNDVGGLFLSVREGARAIGVAANTAAVALDLLEETGWLRAVQRGHFAVKAGERQLRATVWRLTFQPHPQSERGPTMDFMDWQPEEIIGPKI